MNGRIAAVPRSWTFETDKWSAIVDPDAFRRGVNRVELFAFEKRDGSIIGLRPVPSTEASPIAGLTEKGLYGLEEWPQGAVRWTDGDAEVTVPVHRSRPPSAFAPDDRRQCPDGGRLRVAAHGTRLLDARLDALGQGETWSETLDLEGVEIGDQLTVGIESDTFVPSRRYEKSSDTRRLGVAILAFELLDDPREHQGPRGL